MPEIAAGNNLRGGSCALSITFRMRTMAPGSGTAASAPGGGRSPVRKYRGGAPCRMGSADFTAAFSGGEKMHGADKRDAPRVGGGRLPA